MTCREAEADLGAYVLGALEPGERRRFEEHLARCPECAEELAEFRALPALLDRVDPAELTPVAVTPSPELFTRMSAAAVPPSRLRTRAVALVAAALLAVLGIGVTIWVTSSPGETVTATAGAVRATITVTDVDRGSALDVSVAGMRPDEVCHLVAVGRDGVRHAAGEWPASPAGDGTWRGWADVDRDSLAAVILVGDGDRELVRAVL